MHSESAMPGKDASVTLREVSKETLRAVVALKVAPRQEHFVASNAISIAEAYFEPKAWFRAIYADETPVGFVMLHDDAENRSYYLWRFMIDQRFQGLGFGAQALERVVEYVRTRPGATALTLSCVPGEGSPGPFYERQGFAYTGEEEGSELVMRRELE